MSPVSKTHFAKGERMLDNQTYNKLLKLIPKNPAILSDVLSVIPASPSQMEKASKSLSDHSGDYDYINKHVRDRFVHVMTKQRCYKQGKDLPHLLEKNNQYLLKDTRDEILGYFIDCNLLSRFYPYARKILVPIITSWIADPEQAVRFLNKNINFLQAPQIDALLKIIPDGINNCLLTIGGSKALEIRRLSGLNINDPAERHEIINGIAKSPSIIGKMNLDIIKITYNDLEKLPPARRFDFIRYLYEPLLGGMSGRDPRFWGRVTKSRINTAIKRSTRYKYFEVTDIPFKKMTHLLFAVSIKKNSIVKVWVERYKEYLAVKKTMR